MSAKILITGATGFIGGRLCAELCSRGERPVCLVRKTSDSDALKRLGAGLVYGDVTDEASLSAVPRCDVIFHCAALVEASGLKRLRACNVGGTENICRLALRTGARLVHVSSIAVVSGNPGSPVTADMPYAATNDYGISKIEAEQRVLHFRRKGLACAILRPPMVYGEGEPHAQELLFSFLARRLLPLPYQGRHLLHLAYVGNVVSALVLAMERPEFLKGVFFACDKEALSAAEAFGIIADSIGAPRPFSLPGPLSSALLHLPIIGKRIRLFSRDRVYDMAGTFAAGYRDSLSCREALANTGKWWIGRKKQKKDFVNTFE